MIRIQKILFPTEFSEYADYSRPYVLEIARKFGAEILLMHAIEFHIPGNGLGFVDYDRIMGSLQELARNQMGEYEKKLSEDGDGIRAKTILRTGTSHREIVAVAKEEAVDLIILATHGRGAIGHLLIGSTAEQVVRLAPCPVLTVRHPEHEFLSSDEAGQTPATTKR